MSANKIVVGWREWLCLPELGVSHIKAKIDTGARTSALHAFQLERYHQNSKAMVSFTLHPIQRHAEIIQKCESEIIDERWVTDSGGHKEKRYVILSPVRLGGLTWDIEMTLTNRDIMKFRMLLGRTAMKDRIIVDPGKSYIFGRYSVKKQVKAK
jgi:hypothetical protein